MAFQVGLKWVLQRIKTNIFLVRNLDKDEADVWKWLVDFKWGIRLYMLFSPDLQKSYIPLLTLLSLENG